MNFGDKIQQKLLSFVWLFHKKTILLIKFSSQKRKIL